MADGVDSDSNDEIEYSGMIQPPLIKQLRTILSEYPDDGQILKEIIQNAEDAGASEMKILYDGRRTVQHESTKRAPFRKYFRGPALLVYNNAVFSEEDWRGIKMLYSSIKEFDRTKVGRFGLGFKSVFHITDHPLIISGKQLLVIDPHQDSSKVCQTMQLRKLYKYKKMKVEDCLEAFSGVLGFEETTLDRGHFQGTIFRFPLREEETELSDNKYNKSKVKDLFESFKDEAPVSLLFLKCLESITLMREEEESLKTTSIGTFHFSVKINELSAENVRAARANMRSKIQDLQNTLPSTSILNSYEMTVCVTDEALCTTSKTWKVMNLFKGKSHMSSNLQKLSLDESLSYSPYVGVAMDMDFPLNFQGHIFCFLPLPLTEKSLSGLPIHVNGFFALSQNRRVVKWPTADQIRHNAHTDKTIQWNQALVTEVLSELYCQFILELAEESQRQENQKKLVAAVSQCIPDVDNVDEHWKILISPMITKLKDMSLFFTSNDGGKWIHKNEAAFLRAIKFNYADKEVETTVRKILEMYHQNTVDVEDHVWKTMKLEGNCEVTPDFINMILRKSGEYTSCSDHDKFNLLRFLSSCNVNKLEGLYLVPLQSGEYTKFSRDKINNNFIHMVPPEVIDILVGMDDVVLRTLPPDLQEIFSDLIKKGVYQIQCMHERNFIDLLKQTIQKNISDSPCPIKWTISKSNINYEWLEKVWNVIVKAFPNNLGKVSHLPLIPERVDGNDYRMHSLKENLVQGQLSKNIVICLELLSIKVLESLPEFVLQHPQLYKFIPSTSKAVLINAIDTVGQMYNWTENVGKFNENATADQRKEFLQYFSRGYPPLNECSQRVLQNLNLFETVKGYVSIIQNQRILSQNLPVRYPSDVILTRNAEIISFAKELGARELRELDVFKEILHNVLDTNFYSHEELLQVMKFVIEKKVYNKSDELLHLIRRVPFVQTRTYMYKKASELYDPDDEIACKIIVDESMFPAKSVQAKGLKVLRKLGLKSREMLTATDIYHAAIEIHRSSFENRVTSTDKERQSALMKILITRRQLFHKSVQDQRKTLRAHLMHLEIIRPQQSTSSQIPNLTLYKSNHFYSKPSDVYHSEYQALVGSVAPIISSDTSSVLVEEFGWQRTPDLELVLEQHSKYVENYEEDYKSEYLLPIKLLYKHLADLHSLRRHINIPLENMWMGDGFTPPNQICINKSSSDIDLHPYLVPLPKEFQTPEMKQLAEHLGCTPQQSPETLISILNALKNNHEKGQLGVDCVLRDLDIIVRILNKLKSVSEISSMNVPVPIHSSSKTKLEFRLPRDCNYCNAEWLKDLAEEEGESMFFVHEDVTSDTAAKLGVPSLTENLLSETEGIEEWGQSEPLTRRIKNLLKDYKDGFAVPKEIVQNADDAKAKKVCFLYDERENMNCRSRLIDEHMESCQGPALWAFNDALFSQKDLENITKLSGATKADDLTKVGKFGLGFCSVYNLTDVPSFITGSNMVIFDPHAKYLGKAVKKSNPGLKIDLRATKNKILLRRMKNQFMPFNKIFGCNLDTENPWCEGTLFRFPLRTKEQAFQSEISEKAYDQLEMKSMIRLFTENAGNLLLFTQHVKEIEFYHLSRKGSVNEMVLLHRVCREDTMYNSDILTSFGISMKECQNYFRKEPQQVLQTALIKVTTEVTHHCQQIFKSNIGRSETKWFTSWASGTSASLKMGKDASLQGVLPLASIAVYVEGEDGFLEYKPLKAAPHGFYRESHIFCYLPLPVTSPLPVHVNGSFAVSSNRRQLSSKTTDDKIDFGHEWNQALLSDAVIRAYIHLIESMEINNIICEKYQDLWPVVSKNTENSLFDAFFRIFYERVVQQDNKVFCKDDMWLPLSKAIFLDPMLQTSKIGEIATNATIKYRENDEVFLIPLEKQISESFEILFGRLPEKMQSKIISLESFYVEIFLKNINDKYWSSEMISNLVLFALDEANKSVTSKIEAIRCIPTTPNGTLKRPCELVKRGGRGASLFCEEDERFVAREFESYARQVVLKSMGMMIDEIKEDILIERISSVQSIAEKCAKCSIERCNNILKYLQDTKSLTKNLITRVKNIAFLPTLPKPTNWSLSWFLDDSNCKRFTSKCSLHSEENFSCTLAKPSDLYSDSCKNLVGCRELILNMSVLQVSMYPKNVLLEIGVNFKKEIQTAIVVKQLIDICQNTEPASFSDVSKRLLRTICADIYEYLDSVCRSESSSEIEMLRDKPCLLIDDTFVKPNQTAFSIQVNCFPELFGLDRITWKSNTFFLQKIGVKQEFQEEDVIPILKEMTKKHRGKLDEQSLDLACNLVELLAKVYKRTKYPEEFLDICIPDEYGIFSPIRRLCLDDSTMLKKGESLKYPHPKIREADARILGVQSKVSGSLMQNYVKQLKPFGQKEELSDRIKRILQEYPFSEGVLKEMLQNADDAKATEVMFITDFNTYETEQTFDSSWHPLQGPALLAYNNSHFTENDIVGIQHLGRGSKGDDPTKTGQYGVGFNAVYHITDVPSFLSKSPEEDKDTLCVMDPHCKYAPGANECSPGAQFTQLSDLRIPFADVFKCYHEDILLQSPGTVFRLPLRTPQFARESELSNKEVSKQTILNMLETFELEMAKSLLFLRNVTKISIASIENGELVVKNTTELLLSDEDKSKKSEFDKYVVKMSSMFQQKREMFITEKIDVTYFVTIKSTFQKDKKWCLIQTFGFHEGICIPNSVQDAFDDQNLGLLPQGGIAMPLESSALQNATAFCFLPLPCQTGLTLHINGHFSLDNESRRDLWKDDKREYRTQWNYMLLSHVIAPIYAKALDLLQSIMGLSSMEEYETLNLQRKLDNFHSFFPNVALASNHYWKHLGRAVYDCIAERNMNLFFSCRLIKQDVCKVFGYSLYEEKGKVLFNKDYRNDEKIIEIAKDLNMKLVDTPIWICTCMENADISIDKLSPENVIEFLKSENCEVKNIIRINGFLELVKSPFKRVERLIACLEFCMKSENFNGEIEGLPICLLETGNLVEYRSENPVILTPFSDLIPSSAEKKLHKKLHELLSKVEINCIEKMTVQKFEERLNFELDYDSYRHRNCQWNPHQSNIPNKEWMKKLWKFLKKELGETRDQLEIKRLIHPILPWCLIPATQVCGKRFLGSLSDVQHLLIPVEFACHVINLSSFQPAMEISLRKLNLPILNDDCLPPNHPLRHLVASQDRISDVLECLYVHRQLISENDQIMFDDCDKILEYFAGGLTELLSFPNAGDCLDKLRKLPLFTTVHGQKISLEENRDILVLPGGLPADGMNKWAERTCKILLRRNERLRCIFERFNVTEHSICEVYRVHILPFFQNIPEEHRLVHLEYIKDQLLKHSTTYSEEQNKLVKALTGIPFIPQVDGTFKLASEFLSPFNELMKVMCEDPKCYPPHPFSTLAWKNFMTLVGMKTEVTKDLFLEFVLQLELQGRSGMSEIIENKSRCLVNHLLYATQLHSADFLKRVSRIKFVVPHQINAVYCRIYPYPQDKSNHLIRFQGSVMNKFERIIWTQCRILPSWISSEIVFGGLELCNLGVQKPTAETVLTHIQTVCNKIGNLSEKDLSSLSVSSISNLMKTFYQYANDSKVLQKMDINIFKRIPFVFMTEFPCLFPCERFILQLEEKYKMIPYLMALPDEYFGFFQLFEKLGASRKISSKTFAKVLEEIHSSDDTLNVNELKTAQKAMEFLFEFLSSDDDVSQMFENQALYLLSKEGKLLTAESLMHINVRFMGEVIKAEKHFSILSSIEGMDEENFQAKIKCLPKRIRPMFISDVITSKIDVSKANVTDNQVSREINDFLTSSEFINGILRLVYQERLDKRENLPSDDEISRIKENLRAICLKCASNIQEEFIYQNRHIQSRSRRCCLDCSEENGHLKCSIYSDFSDEYDPEKVVKKYLDYISTAIRKCTGCNFHKTLSDYLHMICNKVRSRDEIESFLDERFVQSLNRKHKDFSHQLPNPGDVVEIRWHGILDNAFISFEPNEYVAHLTGTNSKGDMEYKYAIVKEKLSSATNTSDMIFLQAYLVQTEPQKVMEMKAYELYKFNRSKVPDDFNNFEAFQVQVLYQREPSEEASSTNNLPSRDNRTLEDIFKEIRECLKHAFTLPKEQRGNICRRVMFQWHPDKNPHDVERATKVFQYIRNIIQKLENGENVDITDRTEQTNENHPWSDQFFREFETFFRREQEYQHYFHRTSSSSRRPNQQTEETYCPNPQPFEASKWLEESKYDLRFARKTECLEDDFFNWICLSSHQAAEKALIAWQYNEDAKRVVRSENLSDLARACPEDIQRSAQELQNLTHETKRMRYPDGNHRPSLAYNSIQANQALSLAKFIVEKVDDLLL
ncbi:sacsin-like [Saccostrea echinata]|uniref:sacsin-like n=1 Tax=Saccostrea echinata TaxID=191078 RepID=UPI002A7FE949|nr:sacsin-like [Saccostrea echinata]